ncbi:YfjI family protein [Pseudomonas amygdali]|uniref:YfjI family protein n=1 Tax=Pseudomonas amygdali TaxID=47877 RepID=UPI00167191F4|nr:YfjI family protein [Pseudomonas amygdali]
MFINYSGWMLPSANSTFPVFSDHHPCFTSTIMEASTNLKLPNSMMCLTALSAIAATLQGSIDVEMPSGGSIPVSLNVLITVPSGGGKNRTMKLFQAPIEEFERKMAQDRERELIDFKTRLRVWELQLKRLERVWRDDLESEEFFEHLKAHDINKPSFISDFRMVFEDTTPEALLFAMGSGVKSAYLKTSEGGIVLSQHAMKNMPALNQLWSGDRVTVDRKTSESFILDDVRVSVMIMCQPGIFESFVERHGSTARDSGFFARCLVMSVREADVGGYEDGQKLNWSSLAQFHDRIRVFLQDGTVKCNRTVLRLTPCAKEYWLSIKNSVVYESKVGGRFRGFKDLSARTPENIIRVAAILHHFEGKVGDVSIETVEFACKICFWHVDQFLVMFGEKGQDEADAQRLYKWLMQRYQEHDTTVHVKNNILQYGPAALRRAERLNAALEILIRKGVLSAHYFGSGSISLKFYPSGI